MKACFTLILSLFSSFLFAQKKIPIKPLTIAKEMQEVKGYQVGSFIVEWNPKNGGHLQVKHNDSKRVLWSNIEGKNFVQAAIGKENIRETRGSFKVKDKLKNLFYQQSIDLIWLSDTKLNANETYFENPQPKSLSKYLNIRGMLSDKTGKGGITYKLIFNEIIKGQLQFEIVFGTPVINRIYLSGASNPNEHFFGFGEQFTHFDMKGKRVPIWVQEQGVGRGKKGITGVVNLLAKSGGSWHSSYISVPHYMTTDMNSIFLENYEYSVFDFRDKNLAQIHAFTNHLKGRIVYGETPSELIENYTQYSGRMRALPDWILEGAIIGMQGGTKKTRRIHAQLKAKNTPMAAFWLQDWEGQRKTSIGKQLWWNWELDNDRYPNWNKLQKDFEKENIQLMIYCNPFLVEVDEKPNHKRNLFKEASKNNYFIKNEHGEPYMIPITSFSASMIDLSNPDAVEWLKEVIKTEMVSTGAKGWMADFAEALPLDCTLHSGESPTTYHNKYPERWVQLNREVIDELADSEDYVFFSRAGYRQSPKYATLFWAGDQLPTWDKQDGFKTAVTSLLSSGLSGFSFNHSDIGGYTAITTFPFSIKRSKELLYRWSELNAFTTIFRTHEGTKPTKNEQFYDDDENLAHFSRMAKVYKSWAFYRKKLVKEASETGLPVVRHPFVHYPNDPTFWTMSYEQFMVGEEFMVVPVLDKGKTKVMVYLPKGNWVHLWSGKEYTVKKSLKLTVDAPIGKPAVFYKKEGYIGATFVKNLKVFRVME